MTRTLRVAAVQTPASPDVAAGLELAAPLVRQAAAEGAELVLLPELMAIRYVFTDEMWDSAEPSQGVTVAWLRDTARDSGVWLGTSFLEATGQDFYNTFVLVGPDGAEAGRVRKQTPAMYEPWFFRGAAGSHVIRTELGVIGVGVCNDNHRSYLPRRLQKEDVDLVLMPHCWPLPTKAGGAVSEADIQRWHQIQMEMAPLYARLLGVPAVFVNKVGPYDSPAPLRWLPGARGMVLPGHATIADCDGTIKGRLDDSEGVLTATVTLDPARKVRARPPTYGRYTYPSGLGGLLALPPAWVFGRVYALNPERRRRARQIAASEVPVASDEQTTLESAPGPEGSQRLSRLGRIGLWLHRESDRRLTPLGIWIMRRTNGGIAQGRIGRMLGAPREVDVLLLTTRGRRSGRERTVVLQYFPDADAMIVTAANDGGASHPAWYLNLKGDAIARVEVKGRTIPVRAEELPAEAAADWWQRILRRAPSYERYQRATGRTFPILRLVPEQAMP